MLPTHSCSIDSHAISLLQYIIQHLLHAGRSGCNNCEWRHKYRLGGGQLAAVHNTFAQLCVVNFHPYKPIATMPNTAWYGGIGECSQSHN